MFLIKQIAESGIEIHPNYCNLALPLSLLKYQTIDLITRQCWHKA